MGWVSKVMPRPLYPPRKTRYPLYQLYYEPKIAQEIKDIRIGWLKLEQMTSALGIN